MATKTMPTIVGPLECPKCGSHENWRADYYQAVHQGVTIVMLSDGTWVWEDWDGAEESYDDGATENERLWCANCKYSVDLATFGVTERDEREVLQEIQAAHEGAAAPGA